MARYILVVDDDKICNFLTVNSLRKVGIQGDIEVVINGLEAINKLKELSVFPDFILLDINMPVMNGLDFLENYKTEGFEGKTKIAMYTSSIRESDKKVAFQYNDVIDFINKPLTKDKLLKLIKKI
tara:strand:- start:252 stop:626 length:375 start_codon:yes stop_codon:yes gene_type:complete